MLIKDREKEVLEIRDKEFQDWLETEEVIITIKHDFMNCLDANTTFEELSCLLKMVYDEAWEARMRNLTIDDI